MGDVVDIKGKLRQVEAVGKAAEWVKFRSASRAGLVEWIKPGARVRVRIWNEDDTSKISQKATLEGFVAKLEVYGPATTLNGGIEFVLYLGMVMQNDPTTVRGIGIPSFQIESVERLDEPEAEKEPEEVPN
jgi:hypothetical protein